MHNNKERVRGTAAAQLLAQAISAFHAGELGEAYRSCALVVKGDKKNVTALHLLGVIEALKSNPDEALKLFDRALKISPRQADILADKGRLLTQIGRHAEAMHCYDRALAANPRHETALYNQGYSLLALDSPTEALQRFDRLVELAPQHPPAYLGRGVALTDLGRFDEAIASFDRALEMQPNYAEALQGRGIVRLHQRRHDLAISDFEIAARHRPDLENLQSNLVLAKMYCCDWAQIAEEKAKLRSAVKANQTVAPFLFLAVSDSPAEQLNCARNYANRKYPSIIPPLWHGKVYRHDKIRIAYVSADLHEHPVAFLVAGIFAAHDRARFDVTVVSIGRDDNSDVRNRIRAGADNFIDARTMHDSQIAELLHRNETDILLDMNGHTDANRFRLFSHRVAPVQVSYLGYPGTTGAPFIDYVIADPTILPTDQHPYYSEKTVILPHCYQINDAMRTISDRVFTRSEMGLPPEAFVFCCFNSNYKITPEIFERWMRILGRTENSVLWLYQNNAAAAANLRKEAVERGIDADRVIFAGQMPLSEHLARHRLADLFLDTFPYNAHTTASDALWTGLPLVTCMGQTFASRVAASLLRTVGLPELVTTNLDDYESFAVDLGTHPGRLTDLKRKLAAQRLSTPLFDTAQTTRHIEAAYTAMHERSQAGLSPDHIVVAP